MASSTHQDDSWKEYQKLVLSELERLDESMQAQNNKLDKALSMQESVADLKKWKEEKAEPEIQSLKEFKSQIKTYGTVGQILIAAVISYIITKLTGGSAT